MICWKDRRGRLLYCNGREIQLTAMQANTLDPLLECPGRMLSAEAIAQHAYMGAREPEDAKKGTQVRICQMRKLGVPIQSQGTGVDDCGYSLLPEDIGFQPGMKYTARGCQGSFRVKRVIDVPVVVFISDALGEDREIWRPIDDPVMNSLERAI